MTFKVGDRVVAINDDFGFRRGERGTVIKTYGSASTLGVMFEHWSSNRHSCGGLTKEGYGWNVDTCDLNLDDANQEPLPKKREW